MIPVLIEQLGSQLPLAYFPGSQSKVPGYMRVLPPSHRYLDCALPTCRSLGAGLARFEFR